MTTKTKKPKSNPLQHLTRRPHIGAGVLQGTPAMSAIRLYRPSNGTEGMIFQEKWCDQCRRGQGDGCRILSDSMVFDVDEKGYPPQMRYVDDVPTCAAFVHKETQS